MTVACKYPKWFLLFKIFCNLALADFRICAPSITSTKIFNKVYQFTVNQVNPVQLKIRKIIATHIDKQQGCIIKIVRNRGGLLMIDWLRIVIRLT